MSEMCRVRMVSLTILKTTLMFLVSVAVVKWRYSSCALSCLTELNMLTRNVWISPSERGSPLNSGKLSWIFLCLIFSVRRSVLLKKRITDTFLKQRLLTIVSKMLTLSTRRFVTRSSKSVWSNALEDTRKRMDVTSSKHWNHFCLCDLWPPTSTKRKGMPLMCIMDSCIPRVAFREWRTSSLVGI